MRLCWYVSSLRGDLVEISNPSTGELSERLFFSEEEERREGERGDYIRVATRASNRSRDAGSSSTGAQALEPGNTCVVVKVKEGDFLNRLVTGLKSCESRR
jgi:hypothetical protein